MISIQTQPKPGDWVDLAPFAQPSSWNDGLGAALKTTLLSADENGNFQCQTAGKNSWQLGLEWLEPQEIASVSLQFAGTLPAGTSIKIQYWRQNFPTIAPERLPGARRGWIGCDDPYHGKWVTIRGEGILTDQTYTFKFDPLDRVEVPVDDQSLDESADYLPLFRRTLKLRALITTEVAPTVSSFSAFSLCRWEECTAYLLLGVNGKKNGDWSGKIEVPFGYLLDLQPLNFENPDSLQANNTWKCDVKSHPKGLKLSILAIQRTSPTQAQTLVTARTAAHSFTFQVSDLDRGPIYIRDYDVLVHNAGESASIQTILAAVPSGIQSIYDRVENQPEQSLQRATADVPPLDPLKQGEFGRYLPLSLEDGRQEFAIRYNGELFVDKASLKLAGRDAARLLYPGSLYRYRFGSGDPPEFRENSHATKQSVEKNWLPVVHSAWLDREIHYTETALVAPLSGEFPKPGGVHGEEDIAAYVRFNIRNTTSIPKTCSLWIAISPQEQLVLRENAVYATARVVPASPVQILHKLSQYEEPRLRCKVDFGHQGTLTLIPYSDEKTVSHAVPTTLLYQVSLAGGEEHDLVLTVPFATPLDPNQVQAVSLPGFSDLLQKTTRYWEDIVETGMHLETPDPILADFHKAAQVHVSISGDKDPVSGLTILPPGSWGYRACGNEACWQISMLDQAGQHQKAEHLLEIFLHTQGVFGLDGNFTSTEGALQGLDLDEGVPLRTHFSYNLDHGVIMECLADHYRYTGDRTWLDRVAPNLIASCDFITRERAATRILDTQGERSLAWGLLPAGHLEDNVEWRHWFAVNAHACNGMNTIAGILAEIDHPDAKRIQQDAAAYREDIRNAAIRAMINAPVVRILDGTYIPRIPTRTHQHGREWGWFREAAYGAIHLLEGNIFAPDEPEMTWVIKDLEDNLYVTREWGRPVDLEKQWFSQGGLTIQPNLTDMAIDYLRRGQIKHGLRALFNNFATSLYRDVRVFTEHPVIELGHGVGPFYKSSDEGKALVWLRSFLLGENGDELSITPGASRAWFSPGCRIALTNAASFFGPLSFSIESTTNEMDVSIDPPQRKSPKLLRLFLRTPQEQRITKVTLNGKPHTAFNPDTGEIQIKPTGERITLQASYS